MGERGVLQRHSNALIFVLAGTAAVAVAAACYNRRHRLPKRPHDGQQSANLQQLLAEVRDVCTKVDCMPSALLCALLASSRQVILTHKE